MEMMNRAIEDAADFTDFKRKLEQRQPGYAHGLRDHALQRPPKRPGENREQYRARLRALESAK
jgi:hypothetical protein